MKKLLATAAVMLLGSTLLAAELPQCSAIGEIIQDLEHEGIHDVLSMKLMGNKWVIVYGEEGSERIKEKHVRCIPEKMSEQTLKRYHQTAPPSEETMDVAFITTKALNEEEGVVTKVEFKDEKWVVIVNDGLIDTELIYNPDGELEYKIFTD